LTASVATVRFIEPRLAWQEVDHEAYCSERFLESLRSSQLARTSSSSKRPGHAAAEAERDVVLRGGLRRSGSRLSCDEKKKVPVTGTNVFKV
jgi:hypothetical protein